MKQEKRKKKGNQIRIPIRIPIRNPIRKRMLACILAVVMTAALAGCTKSGNETADSSSGSTSELSASDSGSPAKQEDGAQMPAEETGSTKGRYIETQIDIPQSYSAKGTIRRLSDESLVLIDAQNASKSISKDNGKTWETDSIPELSAIMSSNGAEFTSIAVTEDGMVFLSYISWEETDAGKSCPEKYVYFSLNEQEKMQKFELGIEKYKTNLTESVFSTDGRLFAITATSNVYEINLEKKSCRQIFELENAEGADLCTNEDSLIVTDGRKVYFYSLDTGEIMDEDEPLNAYTAKQSEKSYGIVMCAGQNGKDNKTLYLAGCSGIARHVIDGSVMEQLVDGALSNLGDPSKIPEEIIQNQDGSFLVLFEDGELDSYVYDKEAETVPAQQLTIYGLYDNETIRQAVSLFRKKNPEIFVRFETGLSGATGMTKNDAVKNLNTKLLAGEGPDIILLDEMPLDSYQEKGILMDLSSFIKKLEQSDDYFEGILNGYKNSDGTYALPFRFQIPLLAGDTDSLSQVSDLKTLADEAERLTALPATQETVLGAYSPEETLNKLYLTSANAWTDAKGNISQEALQDFLTDAERIYQADQKNLDEKGINVHREYTEHISRAYKGDERKAEKVLNSIGRVFSRLEKKQVLTAGYLYGMPDFRMLTSVKRQLGQSGTAFGYQAWNGQDGELFCPSGTVGISAVSQNKESAQEFIRVLLGSDVQGKDFEEGFPVNASAYEAFTADPLPDRGFSMGSEDRDGNEVMLGMPWPGEEELKQLKTIIQSLKTPAVFDDSLKNEVITIGAQALKGEKTIEESAAEIAQKIRLYLTE